MSSNYQDIHGRFKGEEHAKLYSKYRPSYPQKLYDTIKEYCQQSATSSLNLAVDVGCGNGQSTFPLAQIWKNVIGIDISGEQISEARKIRSNVDFRVGLAEDMSFQGDETVDLLTAGTAIHWINKSTFWREATRVLRPGGVLAVYSYNAHKIHNKEAHHLVWEDFYNVTLKDCWTEHRQDLDNGLALVELPFEDSIRMDPYLVETEVDIDAYIGFLKTWSSWQIFEKQYPETTVLMDLRKSLRTLYTDEVSGAIRPIKLTSPIYLLIGRKPIKKVL